MSYPKNILQSNCRLNQEGDYLAHQSFNLPNLNYYTQEQAWDYLRSLNYYKAIINYMYTLP